MSRFTLLTSCLVLSVSGSLFAEDKTTPAAVEKITYVDHVLPIFRQRCGSCHNASDRKGGLALDNFAAVMEGGSSGAAIEVGDPGNSYLWSLVNHESEPKMPPKADKLPDAELAIINKWITLGALENAGSTAVIKKKPSLTKIEVSTARPAEAASPTRYFGDPTLVTPHRNAVTALACSPWAPLTAVSGFKQVALYNTQHLELLGVLPFPEGQPEVIKFSRNGSLLMVGGGRGGASGRVVVYDVKTGERKVEVGDEYDAVLAADISSDQTMIALGGPKKMLRVYSTATGELLSESKKHTDWITAIEFSPDGVLLASGDRSNGLIIWEAFSGQLFYDLQGHKGPVSDISWRPDSNAVASSSEDGTIKLWEMQNGGMIKSWDAHPGGVTSMDYTREGQLVSTGRDRITRLWNGDGAKVRDFPALGDIAMKVAYDAETKRVLAGDWTGIVTVWNADTAQAVGQIDTNPQPVSARLVTLNSRIKSLQDQLAAQTGAAAALRKKIADREQAAATAQAAANQAAAAAQQATAAKQNAEKEMQAQAAGVAAAEKAVKETQAALAQANSEQQTQTQKLKSLQDALTAAGTKVASLAQSATAAQQALTQAKAAADAAVAAAQPTEAEKPLLASDEQVKQAVATRQTLAKSAQDVLTQAQQAAEKAQLAHSAAQKEADQAKMNVDGAAPAVKTAQDALTAAKTKADQAAQALEAARKGLATAQAAVASAVTGEQAAVKAAAETKAAADAALAASKPTEDEQKAIAAADAAAKAFQEQLTAAQDQLGRLQKIQSELAQATAATPAP